jgi:DNA invertase Pin-like site-specific DNA recombinase
MYRAAIYARPVPGRACRHRLDCQVVGLAAQVARQPTWRHVATYGDLQAGPSGTRPGFSRLLADAPDRFDLLVVDSYWRLSADRRELHGLLVHLAALGVRTVVLRPTAPRRLGRLVANAALADLIGEAAAR